MKKLTSFILSLFISILSFTFLYTTLVIAQVYPDGMVCYLKFEEGNGNIALDSVGNNDGTIIGGATYTVGKVGSALILDGVDDYIDFGDTLKSYFQGSFTISLWTKPADGQPNAGDAEYYFGYYYRDYPRNRLNMLLRPADIPNPGSLTFNYWTNDITPNAQTISPVFQDGGGNWYHVAIVADDTIKGVGGLKIYVDGVEKELDQSHPGDTSEIDLSLFDIPYNFVLGAGNYAGVIKNFINGIIDEFAIYNRVLTPEEIQQHYQNGLDGLGYELSEVLQLKCVGFESPMDKGPVTVKQNRVLPLKAVLLDSDSNPITDADITALPVLQVFYDSGTGSDPIDVTDEALPAGQGTEGNQFVFTDEGKWQFNLKTKNYTAPGTYTIYMNTGDSSEYVIDPQCEASFMVK